MVAEQRIQRRTASCGLGSEPQVHAYPYFMLYLTRKKKRKAIISFIILIEDEAQSH